MDYQQDALAYCWGSTDHCHRFWLVLFGDGRCCINCRQRERQRLSTV